MSPKKVFFLSVLLLLGVLAACEIAARHLLPDVPGCAEDHRNPFRFRGWPEYMDGAAWDRDVRRLFLISNSQAYAGEYPSSRIYAAVLERRLNEKVPEGEPPWKVCNWAVDGATPMEYDVMVAALKRKKPDLVLAMIGYADFRGVNFGQGFDYCRTDVPLLVGRPEVLAELPAEFLRRHAHVEDMLTCAVAEHLSLMRLREYMWSWLDARFPGIQTVFYAPMVNYRFWEVRARPLVRGLDFEWYTQEKLDFSYDDRSTLMLREFLEQLRSLPCRAIVATGPVRLNPNDQRGLWHRKYALDITALAAELDLPYWDLTDALPAEDFLTSSHFNHRNHRRFGELLAERLAQDRAVAAGEEQP